ncbi:MAG: hypothetical protein IJ262_00140 [Clostridia bacterium]|nr:hypothetical protein [Clostridia bacterium]
MNNNQLDPKENEKDQHDDSSMNVLSIIMTALFSLIIVSVSLFFVFSSDKEMSESENRVLAQRPALTFSSLADGSFMTDFESWLADQFPLREKIIQLKTEADRLVGIKEENGVYIGKNGFLFEKQSSYNSEKMNGVFSTLNSFSKKNKSIKTAFVLSPNSSALLSQYLPSFVAEESQKSQLKAAEEAISKGKIQFIDCYSVFEKQEDKEKLFYKTDHHWTSHAALEAFRALMKNWKIDISKTKFEFQTVSSSFQGTLASSSQVRDISDSVEICFPSEPKVSSVLYYEAQGTKTASYFDKSKLENKNHYEVFMGGNFDKIIISTSAETENALLILKDSYANCMIPMFAPFFSKIVVVDPRYCSDKLSEIMKDYDFSHMAFIYNLNTFLEDTSLEGFLKK